MVERARDKEQGESEDLGDGDRLWVLRKNMGEDVWSNENVDEGSYTHDSRKEHDFAGKSLLESREVTGGQLGHGNLSQDIDSAAGVTRGELGDGKDGDLHSAEKVPDEDFISVARGATQKIY